VRPSVAWLLIPTPGILHDSMSAAQAHCGDAAVDAKVNEKVVQFCAAAARHPDKVHQVGFQEPRSCRHTLQSCMQCCCTWHTA